jgi:hypothetical protein
VVQLLLHGFEAIVDLEAEEIAASAQAQPRTWGEADLLLGPARDVLLRDPHGHPGGDSRPRYLLMQRHVNAIDPDRRSHFPSPGAAAEPVVGAICSSSPEEPPVIDLLDAIPDIGIVQVEGEVAEEVEGLAGRVRSRSEPCR